MAESKASIEVDVDVNLTGFDPERHPLIVAVGKDGKSSKLWWKGEPLETVMAVYLDARRLPSRIIFGSLVDRVVGGEDLAARQRKVIREMNRAGFEVFVENEEGKKQ